MRTLAILFTVLFVGSVLGLAANATAGDKSGAKAPKFGQEQLQPGEEAVIKQLVALQLAIMKKTDPTKRGQHPNGHGCVDAEFTIRGDVPKEYKYGLFKEAKTYQAKIRYSNGGSDDDSKPDIHGMAVRVLGVKGPRAVEGIPGDEQDFILIDSAEFFAPDPQAVLGLLRGLAAAKGGDPKPITDFVGKNPNVKKLFDAAQKDGKSIGAPLAVPYWSTVPYKLGSTAVKYAVAPGDVNKPVDPQPVAKDMLRKAMVDHLTTQKKSAVFNFYLIPQPGPDTAWIEDPTRPWPEDKRVHVATIKIGPQTFDTPERQKECEAMSFSPWHALAAHQPLGGINRARRDVYKASFELRTSKQP